MNRILQSQEFLDCIERKEKQGFEVVRVKSITLEEFEKD